MSAEQRFDREAAERRVAELEAEISTLLAVATRADYERVALLREQLRLACLVLGGEAERS